MNLVESGEGRDHDTRVAAPDGRGFVLAPVRVRDADPATRRRSLGESDLERANAKTYRQNESRPRRQRNRLGREMLMHSNGLEPSP